MNRAHKTRIYPNREQAAILLQQVGGARFAYNWALERWNKWYDEKNAGLRSDSPNWMKLSKLWTAERPEWAKSITRTAVTYEIKGVSVSYTNHYRLGFGKPKFKKRGKCKDAFHLAGDKCFVRSDLRHIRIPMIRDDIRMAEKLRLKGKILSFTVSTTAGRWYVSVQMSVADTRTASASVAGVDVGMKSPAVCSDSTELTLPVEKLSRLDRRIRRGQRRWSRTKKNSHRRAKALLRLQRIREKRNNIRRDAIHKFTSAVCKNHATVVVEDLKVRGLTKCPKHIRACMSNSCMNLVLRQIRYKAINLVVADKWYPSTQLCHVCGHRHKMGLDERVYNCPSCGLSMDRDLNAAINLSKYPGSQG